MEAAGIEPASEVARRPYQLSAFFLMPEAGTKERRSLVTMHGSSRAHRGFRYAQVGS